MCHLHRSLYGLKQSRRCWNKELSCHLVKTGFQQSIADLCVFFQWKEGKLNVVSIYVDDLILVVDMLEDLQKTKEELSASASTSAPASASSLSLKSHSQLSQVFDQALVAKH